ncbi:hypothetical protein M1413_00960 [Patescibacteria group bacterium]|jgi:ribosomal protein L35|nr:hypothetical protein [Patescibacteria group bacterium]MCL5114324.1 hypothetical protein [Patescibacteria group bacterium]
MKKSVSKRIRITKSGKVLRRAMALGHSRANKRTVQIKRKKNARTLGNVDVQKLINN